MAVNDSDDLSHARPAARSRSRTSESHPECVLLGSRVMLMDPFGSPVVPSRPEARPRRDRKGTARQRRRLGAGAIGDHGPRRRRPRRIGGYRGEEHNLAEDHDLFVRLAEVGKVANLEEPLRVVPPAPHEPDAHAVSGEEAEARAGEGVDPEGRVRTPRAEDARDVEFEPWRSDAARGAEPAVGLGRARSTATSPIARKHATDALKHSPLSLQSWKLMAVRLRGDDGSI